MSADFETDGIVRMAKELFAARAEIARLTERCDAYREALEKAEAVCDVRIAHFSGVLELGHDNYIHGRRAEATVIKREIAALASPAQEQKDKTT